MITGKETVWADLRKSQIEAEIILAHGIAPQAPNALDSFIIGLSKADVAFLTANALIDVTIPVTSAAGSTSVGTGVLT